MKILNLYANIGGNRKLWGDEHDITSIEIDPKIANVYKDLWPHDNVVIGDAHQYLLEHYNEFDFIWASPPCPTHSKIRKATSSAEYSGIGHHPPLYPDMTLYQEILFLRGYFKGKWCVENVISWYTPLIAPIECGGHYFWTNFLFPPSFKSGERGHELTVKQLMVRKGFDLSKYTGIDKRLMLRDITEPELGKHILDWAMKEESTLFGIPSPIKA